ncbi:hypothetical protein PHYSODRAFT_311863 [Phytophthora sojae]|uniref:Chromo domain-containing protein n=1 Tax=Phytophthora sojae (strain P6497) TaxID=1094619 RepID=G4YSC9_PHYSP|nr:hypothetical protein PHYSODRAFT_311863 [Phytophthora sojae]EGZ25360.1 hypothetical protein PHYSODRAFT_311863 [Phytophthora sojae]|eukprot:XP_009520648.1 hypothetical protein PHYSODRAFT_311863 [Phytophthora sojae]
MKALTSELKLQLDQWREILPLDCLGDIPPVTAFTGLPGSSQLTTILSEPFAEGFTLSWIEEQQKQYLTDVRAALDTIHQQAITISERRNVQARGCRTAKPGVRMATFPIGDFVLAATAIKGGSKLSLYWRGPKRVVRPLNDYTFEVQDICAPYTVTVRHASRLKFYREAGRGFTEDLVAHALHGEGGHLEIFVQWIGLDAGEASWEPASVIFEDVPQLVRKFVAESRPDHLTRRMWTKLSPDDPIEDIERRQPDRGRRKRRI